MPVKTITLAVPGEALAATRLVRIHVEFALCDATSDVNALISTRCGDERTSFSLGFGADEVIEVFRRDMSAAVVGRLEHGHAAVLLAVRLPQ